MKNKDKMLLLSTFKVKRTLFYSDFSSSAHGIPNNPQINLIQTYQETYKPPHHPYTPDKPCLIKIYKNKDLFS